MLFRVAFAGPGDLDTLVEHRLGMWRDIRPGLTSKVERSRGPTRRWIREKLSKGELVGFIAKAPDGRAAGSGCIWLREEQPRPDLPRQVVPYLLSMYTVKEFRRQGVAKEIVRRAVKWSKDHHHGWIVLHASDYGRHLYEEFGFRPTREMRLEL